MLRDLRRSDGPQYVELIKRGFPEESAVMGSRPEEFERIIERGFRWDSRLILGLLRLVGRPLVRILVIEEDRTVIATALLTFGAKSEYVSNVVVDESHRRRGHARRLLEEAHRTAQRYHRPFTVLDVLEANTPARMLYESMGYRPLRTRLRYVHDAVGAFAPTSGAGTMIRPMERRDLPALIALARQRSARGVESILPSDRQRFVASSTAARLFDSEAGRWVIDRGRGVEGHVGAVVVKAMGAGFLSSPLLAESVEPDVASALVTVAGRWSGERGIPGLRAIVDEGDAPARAALAAVGFEETVKLQTLYRPLP